jgi:phage-related minor tail protein
MPEIVDVEIRADTSAFDQALKDMEGRSKQFGSVLTNALKSAVVSGKGLEDVLRGVALSLAGMALDAGLKPLQGLLSNVFSGLLGGILPFAKGGVTPFASGGVVSSPTFFPSGKSIGLMGEAGSEAILPLSRTADGRLGVASGGGKGNVSIVMNVTTPDAASFRKSEAQMTAMLARAASRGTRYL